MSVTTTSAEARVKSTGSNPSGIERRRSRIYVPRWIGLVQGLRTVINAGAMHALIAKFAAGAAVRMDAEVAGLGRWFGRHRMTPVLSPKKTWEGLLGGLCLAMLEEFNVKPAKRGGHHKPQ